MTQELIEWFYSPNFVKQFQVALFVAFLFIGNKLSVEFLLSAVMNKSVGWFEDLDKDTGQCLGAFAVIFGCVEVVLLFFTKWLARPAVMSILAVLVFMGFRVLIRNLFFAVKGLVRLLRQATSAMNHLLGRSKEAIADRELLKEVQKMNGLIMKLCGDNEAFAEIRRAVYKLCEADMPRLLAFRAMLRASINAAEIGLKERAVEEKRNEFQERLWKQTQSHLNQLRAHRERVEAEIRNLTTLLQSIPTNIALMEANLQSDAQGQALHNAEEIHESVNSISGAIEEVTGGKKAEVVPLSRKAEKQGT